MASPVEDLVTVRDWLRYGVSRFNAADLAYGHGTSTALDEAAFLILATLHLPIDTLEPWLEARLTIPERQAIAAVLEARITTRKPAAYLVGAAYIGGHRFEIDERVIVPRSYIGELLCGSPETIGEPGEVGRVLDLCTGSGCLAIVAALTFPEARVDAADISADALAVAQRNVADYGLADRIRLVRSDLFAQLVGKTYDLIIANPPYVTRAAVEAFPPEYRAEPRLAHDGGEDGLELVRRILADAAGHLTPQGRLVVEVGTGRARLEEHFPSLPFLWLDTAASEGEVLALDAADLQVPPRSKRQRSGG